MFFYLGEPVSEYEGMPGAAILLETHTHKMMRVHFCRGACCLWEGAEGRERISVRMDWANTKLLAFEKACREKQA